MHRDDGTVADHLALSTVAASLLPILEAFHRRHRNQHGASHWWSSFQLVRRGARSLASDLRDSPPTTTTTTTAAAAAAAAASAPAQPKTSEKRERLRRQRRRQLLARVALLRDHTFPKAYLRFSQLVADSQHATLGLLLLSVLASLSSILTSVSPSPPRDPPDDAAHPTTAGPVDDSSSPAWPRVAAAAAGQKTSPPPDADRGVAVSRGSLPAARPVASSSSSKQPAHRSILHTHAVPQTSREKKRRALYGGLDGPDTETNKNKSKKSKKKAGDELSNLFGSL